jgi:hypothetical protein
MISMARAPTHHKKRRLVQYLTLFAFSHTLQGLLDCVAAVLQTLQHASHPCTSSSGRAAQQALGIVHMFIN